MLQASKQALRRESVWQSVVYWWIWLYYWQASMPLDRISRKVDSGHGGSGSSQLSSSSLTLLSGFLAVISVNLVIAFYIIMAMKEPSDKEHRPDPTFVADAKASISQSAAEKRDDPAEAHDKEE
ncbi:uncharacterized protein LOC131241905 isoform X1 [Magnolia sinica]|uniref:uncharacterized protein LOC131241905 isoform X1 n=1 Tax=Magnolia sinica TaxID=86752 RepID=UPI00265990F9|nr:uncharacterized protein LOC131241905 isoform X1 [Magnolia sinica]